MIPAGSGTDSATGSQPLVCFYNHRQSRHRMTTGQKPVLQVERISKRFPGVVALNQVSLQLYPGEILAVIGENGAGKSTLMKILAGIQTPDDGQILLDGEVRQIQSVQQAQQLGISLIHQELNLCANLDVGANIFLGREPGRFGWIDRNAIRRESRVVLEAIGLDVSPDVLAGELTIGRQQMVEIAKAVSTRARILIMDEPTSSLSQRETGKLFGIIRDLKSRGVSIIYISHRLGEVEELADRVVVLRDGQNAGELRRGEINHEQMVRHMVGRELASFHVRKPGRRGPSVLQLDGIQTQAFPGRPVSLEVFGGEIVGMAGLVGAGRTELLTTIFGITPPLSGQIRVAGRNVPVRDCRIAIQNGIGLVPEDRKAQGVILEMAIRENITLPTLRRLARMGMIDARRDRQRASELRQQLGIKSSSVEVPAKQLSGGNQQKIVIAKWLALQPRLLLMDEPTRGVDIGAKQEIYGLMDELAQSGVAILFVSSDMEEVLGMSDRMLVMHEGNLAGELARHEFSEEAVMNLATGVAAGSPGGAPRRAVGSGRL